MLSDSDQHKLADLKRIIKICDVNDEQTLKPICNIQELFICRKQRLLCTDLINREGVSELAINYLKEEYADFSTGTYYFGHILLKNASLEPTSLRCHEIMF